MHLPDFVTTTLGWLAYEFSRLQPFIPTYLHLLLSAVFPIFAGAHSSLSRPSSAAKREKSKKKDQDEDASDEEDDEEPLRMEGLSASDAIMFPVLAGCTLTGLYFLLKWLQDPAILNKLLNWYFALFSIFSVSRLVSDGLDVLHSIAFPRYYIDRGVVFRVRPRTRTAVPRSPGVEPRTSPLPAMFSRLPLPARVKRLLWTLHVLPTRKMQLKAHIRYILDMKLAIGTHGTAGLLIGLSTVLWYNFVGKPWFLTNLMGFGFAYNTLQILSPTTFWTGSLILCGLFCYDIYFVFYTPMMVTVAKSLDVPIKLLFPRPPEPRPFEQHPSESEPDPPAPSLSMLGLGDIVLPGIMIGLALRFDLFLFYLKKQSKASRSLQASPSKNSQESQLFKAQYQSVAGGWGDRLWTSRLLHTISPFNYTQPTLEPDYAPRTTFPKPYFRASLIGYVLGMVATLIAMQLSDHAQPALLYLVPFVLAALWSTAWTRGEVKAMWDFNDSAEEVEDETTEKTKQKKTGQTAADEPATSEGSTEKAELASADTPSKNTRSSFFSKERGEARAKRLSDALSGQSDSHKREKNDSNSDEKDKSSAMDKEKDKNRSWFSVSLIVLPLRGSAKSEKLGEDGSESPRYSLRSSSRKEEHSGKRRRIR